MSTGHAAPLLIREEYRTHLMQITREVLETFLKDWQARPYNWNWEVDIQCEIAGRLRRVFELTGHNSVRADYAKAISGFEGRQRWSRVWCEPTVLAGDGCCKPDVAVLDDISDPGNPPDALREGTFPNLWLCEIKDNPGKASDVADDIAKLRRLLAEGRTLFACSLAVYRQRAESGDGIQWNITDEGRLWIITAKMPALETALAG